MNGDANDTGALGPLDHVPCAIARTLSNGTFLQVNATFLAWLGYSHEELVRKRRVQDLLTMGGKIFHQTHWAPLLQMQGSISEVRLEMLHKDRSTVPIIMNAIRRECDGVAVHDLAAFVARDRDKFERELITSRNQLQQAIAEATALQEEAKDRALFAEQMVGIVSHDLRTPLSVIAMSAQILARGEVAPNSLRTLDRISRSTSRANRMIADLLDFTQARIGQGLACSPVMIDAHAAIADTVDELVLAFPERQLRHVRQGETPSFVDGDRLAQLVVNLVSNAMAYGAAAQPVTVSSTSRNDALEVAVHNHGVPIPPETLGWLFKPMVRGTAQGSDSRSVGLGLYIVSEIARAHGGKVQVASDVDTGTTFSACFPRR